MHCVVRKTRVPSAISARTACSMCAGMPPPPNVSIMTLGNPCRTEKNDSGRSGVSRRTKTCGSISVTRRGVASAGSGASQITLPSATRPAGGSLAETNASSAVECTLRTFVPRRMLPRSTAYTPRRPSAATRSASSRFPGASEPSAPIGSIEPVTTTGRSICGRR